MKRTISLAIAAIAIMSSAVSASAQSASALSSIMKVFGSSDGTPASSSTIDTNTAAGNGSLGSLISGVTSALGLGDSSASIDKLAGTWNYSGPAVSFKSENLLLKAGGAAAASTVESKIEPYYKAAGLDKLVLTIASDSTFTFKTSRATLSGTIVYNKDSKAYEFAFKALKKIPVGSMTVYIQLAGNDMQLTFDVTKLMTLVQRISAISGNSSLQGLSSVLNMYDGMTAGFDLKRVSE